MSETVFSSIKHTLGAAVCARSWWLEFLFQAGGLVHEDDGTPWGNSYVTGGDVLPRIVDVVDRDSYYDKASPGYNQGPLRIGGIAEILDGYNAYEGADLFENVKLEQMYHARTQIIGLNRYTPHIGDTGSTGNPGLETGKENMIRAFSQYRDDVYGQVLYLLNGNSTEGLEGDIFSEDVHGVRNDLHEILDAEGPLDLPTQNFAGYGYVALRDGRIDPETGVGGTKRLFWLHYGRNGRDSHNHADTLNLGIMAHELNLTPDLGYPESTGGWPKRHNWTSNTISHNTVVVDDEGQSDQWVGEPKHFDATDRVNLVDVEAPDVYPQTDRYRRTTATIEVDEESSYAVDFFRVEGGDEHLYSFHGAEADVSFDGLTPEQQEMGTYAGEDIPKPEYGEDTDYNQAVGNGYNYLYDVKRDVDPAPKFSVDWDAADTWDARADGADDIGLQLKMLGEYDEVTLAHGDPPDTPGNPDHLTYSLARRSGNDVETTFTAVIEPYEGEAEIKDVSAVEVTSDEGDPDAVEAVRVNLSNGRTDYVVKSRDHDAVYDVDERFRFQGFFAVYSSIDDEPEHAYVHDGKLVDSGGGRPLVQQARPRLCGTVEDFTKDLAHNNEIVVKVTGGSHRYPERLVGNWLYVDTDGERNGAYEIRTVERRRGNRIAFGVGRRPQPVDSRIRRT